MEKDFLVIFSKDEILDNQVLCKLKGGFSSASEGCNNGINCGCYNVSTCNTNCIGNKD